MPVLSNQRHELFAQELAKGKSAHEAYQLAGFKKNDSNCIRMKVIVEARVAEILGNVAERAEITQADVLRELGKIGFGDIRKLFTESGSLLPVAELDDDTAACLSSIEITTRKVRGGDDDEVEQVSKVRLWDKRAALVDIGKHLGMFKERVEHSGPDGRPIEMADMDLARLIAFLLTKAAKQG